MIIRRYITASLVQAILLFLSVLLLIVFLFDCLTQFSHTDHSSGVHAWLFVCCLLPAHLYDLMPMGVFMGAFYAFSTLAQRSELVIMRTLGMSPWRMCYYASRVIIVFMVLTYVVGEFLVPLGLEGAVFLKGESALSFFGVGHGLWLKDGHYFIRIGAMDHHQVLRQVQAFGFDHEDAWRFVRADHAVFDPVTGRWVCWQVSQIQHDAEGLHYLHQDRWASPFHFSAHAVTALLMPLRYMGIRNAFLLQSHGRHNDTNIYLSENALWRQIAFPFFIPLLIFLAIAMAYRGHYRVSGHGMNIALGFLVSLALYAFSNIMMNWALLEQWPVSVSVFGPLWVFLILLVQYLKSSV